MYSNHGLFIDGEWRGARSGATMPVLNPFDGAPLGEIPSASSADLDDALAALQRGFRVWRAVSGWDRAALLRRMADEIRRRAEDGARRMTLETGKPLAESKGEFNAMADQFDWYAGEACRVFGHTLDGRDAASRLQVRFDPVGPVAAFTAWNFPGLLPARKIAPALAAGCSIVIKPSEEAPSATYVIVEAAQAAGLPSGILNVVTGDPPAISTHLIASSIIRKVSVTGSVPVGKQILRLCADGIKRVSMELGGHAPVIVFEDADPVAAGTLCARTKFRNAGQVCISPSRFYVHQNVKAAFEQAMSEVANGLRIGNGLEAETEFGPMANERGRARALTLVDDAVNKGATLRAGGRIPGQFKSGFFFQPTILADVPEHADIMTTEPFAPVAPIATFTAFDEVIERANNVPFGLAAYVFTHSLSTAMRASEALESGMVGVNDMLLAAAEIPFGGAKESGLGREGGQLGMRDYLEPKYIKYRLQ
ncbi:NAD-dependent succinate-semialdehyde dehydrogenase [Paraburkholderia sp. DHOC27]|uniref:NAD-dependent succinate-semialdehyde dehydrogenase n=1 Tax=Paraburkholderia sp. DHOC27 TaxID=2303330 RepID=UPI000E3CFEB0|nr:NAD-dependent succinate-semialdehyde dehydrogenase [Paraburkholderia sp. DHOC27]RFU47602.1 NAD-dependent succinate-semialdehyde dehydrogenase [Paraburkholderia sp. DHOC27]